MATRSGQKRGMMVEGGLRACRRRREVDVGGGRGLVQDEGDSTSSAIELSVCKRRGIESITTHLS